MSRPAVLDRIESLGGVVFDSGAYDLNLYGIRSPGRTADAFDDVIGCAYRQSPGGPWSVEQWTATTDPGAYYLRQPMNVRGTAILVPGQYRSAWILGLHRGSYEALVQRGPVRVYRDDTRDEVLDLEGEEEGLYGINIHASTRVEGRSSSSVGRWSAGCQVHGTADGFARMIALCHLQTRHHPTWSRFTYTLLDAW